MNTFEIPFEHQHKQLVIREITKSDTHSVDVLTSVFRTLYNPSHEGSEFLFATGETGERRRQKYLSDPAAFEEFCTLQAERLLRYLQSNSALVFIVYDGNTPIGFRQYQKYYDYQEKMFVSTLTILDPMYRGVGIAGQVDEKLAKVVAETYKNKYKEVFLISHVSANNISSITRLLKSGYVENTEASEQDESSERVFEKRIFP